MTRAWLRVPVMIGTLALLIAACGGSSGGGGGGEGASAGEAGDGSSGGPTAGNSGSGQGGNSGTGGGDAGATGDAGEGSAGAPTSSAEPRTGMAIVTGGTLAKSDNFQAVLTLGEVPGGNTRMTSSGYRAHLGFVGSVQ